ncbi:cytochrome c [Azospirillum sp.]|uniref:c-type cytochrome n=1 Tax=Azospirillum sp. TaxID=34012 RepID=UPI002D58B982|nr:cytochrome c [Azospirillum sp.]HYD63990.1 cytochrome c [Azospirillum sp.]
MRYKRALVAAGVALAAAVAALVVVRPFDPPAPDPGDAALVALGRDVYAAHCASCHGTALEGQPNWRERKPDGMLPAPPHDPSGHTWHHADAQLLAMVRDGLAPFAPPGYRGEMPAFADVLSAREIAAVVAFIKSTWPADVRERQARISAQQR